MAGPGKYVRYVENIDGSVEHFDVGGEYHYDNDCSMPAHISAEGHDFYYYHGKLHRNNHPAVITSTGYQWYCHDKLHNLDGPASIELSEDGEIVTCIWYTHNRIHRHIPVGENAKPAYMEFYVDDLINYTSTNPESSILINIVNHIYDIEEDLNIPIVEKYYVHDTIHRDGGPAIIYSNGTKIWMQDGKRHREVGPAVTKKNGSVAYYENNLLHREDGPAVINEFGIEVWYFEGNLHNENGPSYTDNHGNKEWFIHGYCEDRGSQPNVSWKTGQKQWRKTFDIYDDEEGSDVEGEVSTDHPDRIHVIHRENGPAIIYEDGSVEYKRNGKTHRDDGPAIMDVNAGNQWYLDGKKVNSLDIRILEGENNRHQKRRKTDVMYAVLGSSF
jgi:hypothetical protein